MHKCSPLEAGLALCCKPLCNGHGQTLHCCDALAPQKAALHAGELLKKGNSVYQVACAAGAGSRGAPCSAAQSESSRQTAWQAPHTPSMSSMY